MDSIKTRILVLSDTHGDRISPIPSGALDVAIHCGDLTEESKLSEFRTSIDLLKSIDAPLKLVIAGNHDFTLDDEAYKRQITEANTLRARTGESALTTQEFQKEYGDFGDARKLLTREASAHGIQLLDEGSHSFQLQNGAVLSVYASPYTPSASGWGFGYDPAQGHSFDIPVETDIVLTHGPPLGIFDMTDGRKRAGCPHLFAGVARARPRIHCFGHIHEGWGAKLVAWRDTISAEPSHFQDIDNGKSTTIETLARLRPGKFDSVDDLADKKSRLAGYKQSGLLHSSHCYGEEGAIVKGKNTLFLNASIQGREDGETQWPWMVDIDLPAAR